MSDSSPAFAAASRPAESSSADFVESVPCYHCGETLPMQGRWQAVLGGEMRAFCCAGCQMVAETIHAGGLDRFYERRGLLAQPANVDVAAIHETHALYDEPELQARYVRALDGGDAEVTLMLENIRCAACVWLNEQHVGRQPGVRSIRINYATRRAEVRWDPQRTSLSTILDAIALIGYQAWPFEASKAAASARRERVGLLTRMAVAVFGMMQVMMYAWPVYWFEEEVALDHVQLLRWASLLLTLPVVFYSASPILRGAWTSIRNRHIGMDVPVAIGIVVAFAASTLATILQRGEVYFDSLTMFVAFLLAARYMELRARQEATSGAEELARHVPATCLRFIAWPAPDTATEAVMRLKAGDVIQVRPGDVLPVDGEVVAGNSHVEESLLTGESRPLPRAIGDRVLAGSHNTESPLAVRVTRVGQNTRLAEITRILDQALLHKPKIAELADHVAAWFVAALLILTLVTGFVWWFIEPGRVLPIMVAVLVVSCPCALSLATPAALAAASGALARRGLLVTRGHALETLSQVTDVMLDKTGTLTEGQFSVGRIETESGVESEWLLALAAAAEIGSEHPIARAIVAAAGATTEKLMASEVRNVPGQGVEARVDGHLVRVGNRGFVGQLVGLESSETQQTVAGDVVPHTIIWCGVAGRWLGSITLGDILRLGAAELVHALRQQGVKVHLVSGDALSTVAWWAAELNIEHWLGGVSPEGKCAYVKSLQQQGATVLAVGDGINDGPVLAQAQVSIAVGSGVPIAQAGADAVLSHVRILELVKVRAFSRKVRDVIRQNLAWAFFYNVTAIPLAAAGLVSPWIAGIGMSLSSLLVVGNAWRLRNMAQ